MVVGLGDYMANFLWSHKVMTHPEMDGLLERERRGEGERGQKSERWKKRDGERDGVCVCVCV